MSDGDVTVEMPLPSAEVVEAEALASSVVEEPLPPPLGAPPMEVVWEFLLGVVLLGGVVLVGGWILNILRGV
jgi:hypothetical protein